MKKSSQKKRPLKAKDFVHSKLGSLAKLIKSFKNSKIAAKFGDSISSQCQSDTETREFLLRLLDATTKDEAGKSVFATQELKLPILQFLLERDFTNEEAPYLQQLIWNYSSARHISDALDDEIGEFFNLSDTRLQKFFETLLTHDIQSLRESALELLEVSWNRNRLRPWIVRRVAQYLSDNTNRSSLEGAYLDALVPLIRAKGSPSKKRK